VAQAAYFGVSVKDATIYTTTFPCSMCTKILINSGIIEVVYSAGYADELSEELLGETKIKVRCFPEGNKCNLPSDCL
jgi:dCMP deaminase